MAVLLTDDVVPALVRKPGQHTTLYTDSQLPGFGCRTTPRRRAWTVQYKVYYRGQGESKRTCIGYWPHLNASAARSLAEAVIDTGRAENLHPTEALRRLTGNGSRGVVGDRPKTRPGIVNWNRMGIGLDRAIEFAYLCVLEARYGIQPTPTCSEGSNHESHLAEGLHALPGSDHGGSR